MAQDFDPRDPIERALDRLFLCKEVVQELHLELEKPQNPDAKADLYLATEALVRETIQLLNTVDRYVWGSKTQSQDEEDEDEDEDF